MPNMEVTSDGYFLEIWSKNKRGEAVFPYCKPKEGDARKGFDINLRLIEQITG